MAFNAAAFLEALKEIEVLKGISKETVVSALTETITKAYKKELGGEDAGVRVTLDPDNGIFEMYHVKTIVENVIDDFLEISKEDAAELAKENKGFINGEEFFVPATVDQMRKATALSVKSMMKQKFAEAEKSILYDAFKDKIGTMITGRVEKVDERGISVNIVRSSVYLPKNQLIGDEKFSVGDPIKLYVNGVDSGNKGGARIIVTRSNEGFLKCLFTEEITEIFNGTIEIKSAAREAGERSKVAVYSQDPNVDPAGACIGPNGSRIQKIVGQLGNGQSREKIDIIAYSENPGLYIMESLKPAKVAGVIFNAEKRTATAIVKDDSLSLAIGRRGVNVRLAVKLTGYNIDIKTETDAIEAGLEYQTFEELEAKENELKAKKAMELAAAQAAAIYEASNALPSMSDSYVAPQDRVYEEEEDEEMNEVYNAQLDKEENSYKAPVEEVVEEEVAPVVEETPAPVVEEVEAAPVVEEAPAPVVEEKVEVKTTTSLDELENKLSNDANKNNNKKFGKKFNRKKKEEEEEEDTKGITDTSNAERMSIYTEEELAEFEDEDVEESYDDEEVDYDEYDDYYDEK